MSNLDELERLLEAATPGPWNIDAFDLYLSDSDGDPIHWDTEGLGATWKNDPDPKLIVAAVNSLPALIAAARALDHLLDAIDHGDLSHDDYDQARAALSAAAESEEG